MFKKLGEKARRILKGPEDERSTPKGHTQLSTDTLPLIFQYLGECDLQSCLYVSRTFFELAGKELYSRDRYFGDERLEEIPERSRVVKMRVVLQRHMKRKKRPGVSRAALLGHVTHLGCFAHTPNYCYRYRNIDHNILPNLQTLSLYQTSTFHHETRFPGFELPPYHFDCPFTRHLTPTHLILHDLPSIQPLRCEPIYLDKMFGDSVTKVTLHFYEILSLLVRSREYSALPVIRIFWPQRMDHLHLIFRTQMPWGYGPLTKGFYGYPGPEISETHLPRTIEAVLELILSAEYLRPTMKIEGLEGGLSSKTDQNQLGEELKDGVLDGYKRYLLKTGSREEAEKRMADLDF